MRKNLAKHTAKKLPLAKRVLALCFALIFVCSCLLPAFANGTGVELDTPDTEVVEAADPGTEPEPMDLYDEPAALDDDFAVADEPAAMDDDFAVADEPAAQDDDFAMDDEPAAQGDEVEKPVVDDEPAAQGDEVEKPVEGGEPPVADDTPAAEGATKTTTDASGNIVYEYDTSGTTFPEDDAAALPDGDQVLDQMDAAFSIPTNIYHFWLKKMSSYDLADIAADAETAEMTVEQYLAMYGTEKGCYHIMTAADGANLKDYQFADPTSNDDPEGNSRTFAGWYYTDELGDEQKFVFDEFLYISEGTTVEVYAKWTDEEAEEDEEDEEAEETKKDDPAAAQKAKFKQWYQNLVDCTSEYTLKSLAEEYFATEGFYTYLGSLPDEEQEALWDKLEPVNQPKDDTAEYETAEYEEETQDDGIALLSITAPNSAYQIHVGKKLVLTCDWDGSNHRNYTVEHKWTSSNTWVATVESGVHYQTEKATVTGVRVGQTTITHTARGYYVDGDGRKHYDTTHTDTYTIYVVSNNVKLADDDAAIYFLKFPTGGNQMSNDPKDWLPGQEQSSMLGRINVEAHGDYPAAVWSQSDGKNLVTTRNQKVTDYITGSNDADLEWDATNGYFVVESGSDRFNYIWEQASTQGAYQGMLTDKNDVIAIHLTPCKISRNNSGTYPYHIDCELTIVNKKTYDAKFYVRDPDEVEEWTKVDSGTYKQGQNVPLTTKQIIDAKKVGKDGITYILTGWYLEDETSGEYDADNSKLLTSSEWDQGYEPKEDVLKDGVVKFYALWVAKTQDITIKKQVTGLLGDRDAGFNFTVTLSPASTNVTVTKHFREGNEETVSSLNDFILRHNDYITIEKVPVGTVITIKENGVDSTKYEVSATGATTSGTAQFTYKVVEASTSSLNETETGIALMSADGETVANNEVVVTNDCTIEPDMGVLLDTLPYILILVVVVGGGVLLFLRKRKNDDDE